MIMRPLLALAAIAALSTSAFAQNLIVNGDFEAGNTGFTSGYANTPVNLGAGEYSVRTDGSTWNGAFTSFGDHTSGTGNMMVVNGDDAIGTPVWGQTSIAVTPNTDYYFSAWITSVFPSSPATLQFSINGSTLGSIIQATSGTPDWLQFYATWNSGSNTSIDLGIVNLNTAAGGNDFALDDLEFSTTAPVSAAPEPGSLALLGLIAPVVGFLRRRRA
jgi:hypothetical protein